MRLLPVLLRVLPLAPLISALPPSRSDPNLSLHQLLDIPIIKDIAPILSDFRSGRILDEIITYLLTHIEANSLFPGLRQVLQLVRDGKADRAGYSRGLLKSIQAHPKFAEAFASLDNDLQDKVTAFMNGDSAERIVKKCGFSVPLSPAAKEHFKRMQESGITPSSRRWLNSKRETSPVIYEDNANSKPMTVYTAAEFENWGLTVQHTPSYTFVPTTIEGVKNLIKWAKVSSKRVRAAGYRHTWTNMYSQDGEILLSMLDLRTATTIPDCSSILPSKDYTGSEFKRIELEAQDVPGTSEKKRLARIGAAVTNEDFRRWAIANNAWTTPLNVVVVEITYGGSNAPMCHGGGIRHKTISDLVRRIEYVDANGEHQSVTNPVQLKAAAGSFGLLGIVTHITIELDAMSYANLRPLKQEIGLAIPPPKDFKVPAAIREAYTPAELEAARQDFIQKAETNYYSEWFWFPYQSKAFVNCWNNTEEPSGLIDYPTYPDLFLQWLEGWLGGVINDDPLFRAFPGRWQAVIFSSLAMLSLPPNGPLNSQIKTHLVNALHFRRGIHNMRVRDMELQIPIPPLASDPTKPDWTVAQRAWWDAIDAVYADPKAPMRVALEMRIMGDSDVIMAAQTNNKFGTVSIEVLTSMAAAAEGVWEPFVQEIATRWMNYTGPDGGYLNTRPHWAKEWDGMKVRGTPWKQYLRETSYKDEIPAFKDALAQIGQAQGWGLQDLKDRFSVPLLDDLFF
ncbi:unnamed protein product [Tuber aestivum]|uniref:FAD-binding PCMH-type domain-containing protein n=1 Tax=Tuber aestivum TaxID=59557 RepID=A0A292Q5K5_9PEZI|nr:unnamed protein product [Tuber aestivum]